MSAPNISALSTALASVDSATLPVTVARPQRAPTPAAPPPQAPEQQPLQRIDMRAPRLNGAPASIYGPSAWPALLDGVASASFTHVHLEARNVLAALRRPGASITHLERLADLVRKFDSDSFVLRDHQAGINLNRVVIAIEHCLPSMWDPYITQLYNNIVTEQAWSEALRLRDAIGRLPPSQMPRNLTSLTHWQPDADAMESLDQALLQPNLDRRLKAVLTWAKRLIGPPVDTVQVQVGPHGERRSLTTEKFQFIFGPPRRPVTRTEARHNNLQVRLKHTFSEADVSSPVVVVFPASSSSSEESAGELTLRPHPKRSGGPQYALDAFDGALVGPLKSAFAEDRRTQSDTNLQGLLKAWQTKSPVHDVASVE